MADPRELPESHFWRQWNTQAANQWNARSQGLPETTPDFGQFSKDYSQAQQIAALPFKDRQTALMNQESMAQNAFQNRMAQRQEGRLMQGQQFNQQLAQERLRASMEAARGSQILREQGLRQRQQTTGIKELEDEWKEYGNILGTNPYHFLQNFSRGEGDEGIAKIPGDPTKPGSMGFEIPGDVSMFNRLARIRNALNQSRGFGDEHVQYLYPRSQERAQGMSTLPPQAFMAMQAAQAAAQRKAQGFSANEQQRLEELEAKRRQSAQVGPLRYDLTPQDYAAPN